MSSGAAARAPIDVTPRDLDVPAATPGRRRVVVEASREYDAQALQNIASHGGRSQGRAVAVWQRVTYRLLSDGAIVERREMQFPPELDHPEGRYHAYRWLVTGHLRHGLTPADFARTFRAPEKDGTASPWSVSAWARGRRHHKEE